MSRLTFAAQNLAAEAKSWQRKTFNARLDHIADGLDYYRPGVFCGQETGGTSYLRRLDDTFRHLAPGYKLTRVPHGGRWRHIWVDLDQVRVNASGLMALNRLRTKHAAWAKITAHETKETFFTTSVHLSAGGEGKAQARFDQADRLLDTSAKLNPNGHPEIHAGDFNSERLVGNTIFVPRKYHDGLARARTRARTEYDTYNGRSTLKADTGTQRESGDHLDHIYVSDELKDRVLHWSQRPTVKASDHNLVAIKVRL